MIDMIEHLQMVQQARMQEIERAVEQHRRFAQAGSPKRRAAQLWQLIVSLF